MRREDTHLDQPNHPSQLGRPHLPVLGRRPKTGKWALRLTGAALLAIAIFISLVTLITSIWLSQTAFSSEYYQILITRPGYLPLVRQAIEQDLQPQASFAGVPDDVLLAGLDDETIHLQLRQHVVNFVNVLHGHATMTTLATASAGQPQALSYPADLFYEPLAAYLAQHNATLGLPTTPAQLAAIQEVADQAAQTVLTHIVLIDPAQILALAPAQRIIATLHQLTHITLPVAAVLIALLLLVAFLTIRDARFTREYKLYRPSGGSRAVRAQNAQTSRAHDPLLWPRTALQSAWLAASVFLVPTLVLQAQGLTGRLAIQTAYLQFALETLATRANLVLIVWSGTLFVLTSIGLVTLARLSQKQDRAHK